MVPLASSLKPERLPSIISLSPEEIRLQASVPAPPETAPRQRPRWVSLARWATASAAVVAVAATAFVGAKGQWAAPSRSHRQTASPTLKPADRGGYVRWQTDAVDVVVDKSFSDLAGDDLFGASLDAWRATGASLPSVSTMRGEDRTVGYDPNGPNENVIVYAPAGWSKAKGALAVTVVTYQNDTGQIVDADLLVNGGGRFFKRFDRDESSEDDDPVSIENGTSSSTSSSGKTSRFDLQSVVTHELGHFFGLGEDYDDTKGTMYISTRPGEIHKRVLKTTDSDVVTALYAANASDGASQGGCGRAQLAARDPAPSSWIGFGAAAIGLGLLAASRRTRSAELRVRVQVPARRSRRAARLGGWLTVVGLGCFLSPPALEAAPGERGAPGGPDGRGDADIEVVGTAPRWNQGVLETELTYRVTTCHVTNCPEGDQTMVVAGGTSGGITQVVGPFAVPRLGARLQVGLHDHRGFQRVLNPTFKP